jgi:site-specific DNA-methyltransferase (adenine-specific)
MTIEIAPLTVRLRSITQIKPYEKNPRTIPPEAVEAVANSIVAFGFRQPIVVDEQGVIIVGHTRYRAALKLGIDRVPVHVAQMTPEQARAYRIADNTTNTLSSWDMELLNLELSDMPNFDLEDYGLDLSELEHRSESTATDDGFDVVAAVKAIREPKTKPGQIYQLGKHRLMCGDATDAAQVRTLMDGQLADIVWTDPPYNVGYVGKTADALTIENDEMNDDEYHAFLLAAFKAMLPVAKPGTIIYAAHADSKSYNVRGALVEAGWSLRQCLVWVKNSMVMGRQDYHWQHEPILYGWKPGAAHHWYADRTQTTVLNFERPHRSVEHPTMKPIPLVAYCLRNSSRPGDRAMDLFAGSGTTLIAAEQIDRTAYSMEIDPVYCDVIVMRWQQLTGAKAE